MEVLRVDRASVGVRDRVDRRPAGRRVGLADQPRLEAQRLGESAKAHIQLPLVGGRERGQLGGDERRERGEVGTEDALLNRRVAVLLGADGIEGERSRVRDVVVEIMDHGAAIRVRLSGRRAPRGRDPEVGIEDFVLGDEDLLLEAEIDEVLSRVHFAARRSVGRKDGGTRRARRCSPAPARRRRQAPRPRRPRGHPCTPTPERRRGRKARPEPAKERQSDVSWNAGSVARFRPGRAPPRLLAFPLHARR